MSFLRIVAGFVAAVLVALPGGTAEATGTGDPVIISPSDGAVVPKGWTGPIKVDMSDAPATDYIVEFMCDDAPDNNWDKVFTYDGDQDVKSWTIDAVEQDAEDCFVRVSDEATYGDVAWAWADVSVSGVLPEVSRLAATPQVFYPTIRDDYRDETSIGYRLNKRADVVIAVFNANGRKVREAAMARRKGRHGWAWDGKRNNGQIVPVGRYSVRLTATDDAGSSDSARISVTVDSKMVDRRFHIEKKGTSTSSRSKGRGCYIDQYYGGVLELACWRGTYARAKWRFTVPANATKVRTSFYGPSGYNHGGKLILRSDRVSKRAVVATAGVTKWRQEYFEAVMVSYTKRVRI